MSQRTDKIYVIDQSCPRIDSMIDDLNEIRNINEKLRAAAEGFAEEADKWENKADDLEGENSELLEEIDFLRKDLLAERT